MATLSEVEHDPNIAARLPVLKRAMRTLVELPACATSRASAAPGARRSAHGFAAGAHRARRPRDHRRSGRRSRTAARRPLLQAITRPFWRKNELITAVTVPRWTDESRLHESHVALRRRLARARRRGLVRAQGRRGARSDRRRQRRDGESDPHGDRGASVARRGARRCRGARAGDAAVAEASILADAHGSAAYKRELLRVYLRRAVRQALAEDAR